VLRLILQATRHATTHVSVWRTRTTYSAIFFPI